MDVLADLDQLAARVSNWGRWGEDDQRGTLNTITPDKLVRAAGLVRRGQIFALGLPFDERGPMTGRGRRFNPVHTMIATGTDVVAEGIPDRSEEHTSELQSRL